MGTPSIVCPHIECSEGFECEACINIHLQDSHGLKYADAFGVHDEAFVKFCSDHRDLSPSVLGL